MGVGVREREREIERERESDKVYKIKFPRLCNPPKLVCLSVLCSPFSIENKIFFRHSDDRWDLTEAPTVKASQGRAPT